MRRRGFLSLLGFAPAAAIVAPAAAEAFVTAQSPATINASMAELQGALSTKLWSKKIAQEVLRQPYLSMMCSVTSGASAALNATYTETVHDYDSEFGDPEEDDEDY